MKGRGNPAHQLWKPRRADTSTTEELKTTTTTRTTTTTTTAPTPKLTTTTEIQLTEVCFRLTAVLF